MNPITIIGLSAASLTTVAFLPQVIKIWELKEAKDISLGTFLLFSAGVFMWLMYGIALRDLPIILANAITLILSLTILYFKLKYI